MKLLGKEITLSNSSRVLILLSLGVIWRIILGDGVDLIVRDKYIFPVIGFLFLVVVLGELTRRIYRFFFVKKWGKRTKYMHPEYKLALKDKEDDLEALNYAMFWSIILRECPLNCVIKNQNFEHGTKEKRS